MLNMLYVNVNEAPTINRLRPVHDGRGARSDPVALGRQIYDRTCAAATASRGRARRRTRRRSSTWKRTPQEIET